jgi:hypothetical protein
MKRLQNKPVTVLLISLTLSLIVLYAIFRIPSTEGFNPSDDGVILAQSYRMLNGEVPHRDFIAIRPAGSAVMHMINFFSPLPLELSARWFVLLEFLATSILLALLLAGSWFRGLRKARYLLVLAGTITGMFILNQNHYNLFPWTTIDALFWFSVALYGWYRLKNQASGNPLFREILVLFALAAAILCRQTFLLPAMILALRMATWDFQGNRGKAIRVFRRLIMAAVVGLLPVWLYIGMLALTGSLPDFLQQMTGRTELWETGVASFYHSFWHSPVAILFGLAVLTGLVKIWNSESGRRTFTVDLVIMIQKLISFLVKVVLIFAVFLKPDLLFPISFAFFWILILDLYLIYLHDLKLRSWTGPVYWIWLAAWTSAISLGDNAPVFALGWMAGAAVLIQIKDLWERIYRNARPYQWIAAGVLIPALLVLSMMVQKRVNYRDLPAAELTQRGGEVFPGLKGIDLSSPMADYLGEIRKIYRESGSPAGRFAVWPNNALVYPLLDSRNPFPVDWMQPAEYVGSEDRVMRTVGQILATKDLVILVEKMNVKWISSGPAQAEIDRNGYPYLRLLDSLAVKVKTDNRFFNIYRTK